MAIDDDPEVVRPWTEGIGFPVLIDRHHVLTELYAISNVPTVVWIDEEDRIVRPNGVAFGTDTFADFTGVPAGPHLNALRDWVRDGTVPMGEDEARAAVGDLSQDEVRARLHFRVGAEARRQGDDAAATAHFAAAAELAPYDWTVRRAAMPLMGEDPFGERFLALYDEWQDAGMPYHGMVGQLDPSVPGSSARAERDPSPSVRACGLGVAGVRTCDGPGLVRPAGAAGTVQRGADGRRAAVRRARTVERGGASVAQSAGLHEPGDRLSPSTVDRHRALASIQEELEAVDWYDQRVDATDDPGLASVLAHNRDEEKEHAAMTLEWLRRNDPVLDQHLRTYLFTSAPVTEVDTRPRPARPPPRAVGEGTLGIGSLKEETL